MTPAAPPVYDTLADVVRALGDIPLYRILWTPRPGTATEEQLWPFWDHKLRVELIDGVAVSKGIEPEVLDELLAEFAPGVETLADMVGQLGDIPLDRILWTPRPGTATEEDQLRLVDGEPKRLVELIDSILVEKPMGNREALLAMWIGTCLNNFVVPRRLGVVGAPDAMMRLAPGMNRLPDVYFKAWATLPTPDAHRRPVAPYAPDLAVEVLSDRNTRAEIARKRREYFAAGTQLVWIVHPRAETVAVYTDPDTPTVLTTADVLDGGAVLPGFQLRVADLFGYLDPPTPPTVDPSSGA